MNDSEEFLNFTDVQPELNKNIKLFRIANFT